MSKKRKKDKRSKKSWHSAKLRFAITVVPEGANTLDDTIVIFRAKDEDAFDRAIAIGEKMETEYLNIDGDLVSWKLVEMLHLNYIRRPGNRMRLIRTPGDLDGVEVHSELLALDEEHMIPIETVFDPRASEPGSRYVALSGCIVGKGPQMHTSHLPGEGP